MYAVMSWIAGILPFVGAGRGTSEWRYAREMDGPQEWRIIIEGDKIRQIWTAGEILSDQTTTAGSEAAPVWLARRHTELTMAGWRLSRTGASFNIPMSAPPPAP